MIACTPPSEGPHSSRGRQALQWQRPRAYALTRTLKPTLRRLAHVRSQPQEPQPPALPAGAATASWRLRLWTPRTLDGDGDVCGVQQRPLCRNRRSLPRTASSQPAVPDSARPTHGFQLRSPARPPPPAPFLSLRLSLPPILLWTVKQEGPPAGRSPWPCANAPSAASPGAGRYGRDRQRRRKRDPRETSGERHA